MCFRRAAGWALLLFAWGAASCSESTTAIPGSAARLALTVALANPEQSVAADQQVDNVRVSVSRTDETVVKELDVAFPSDASELPIQIDVPLESAQENFVVVVELRAGETPLYGGSQLVTARRGEATPPITVPVIYVGTVVLNITGTGVGLGTVVSTPAGIDCSVDQGQVSGSCTATFPAGTTVSLAPSFVPLSGNYFSEWLGACSGTSMPCTITVAMPKVIVTAGFGFNPCAQEITMAVASTMSGDIASTDCQFTTGQFADYYTFTIGSQSLLSATLTSSIEPELLVFISGGTYWYSTPGPGAASTTQLLALPPRRYVLAASNAAANAFGSYRLTLAPMTSYSGCQNVRTDFGLSQFGATLGNDCAYTTIAGQSTVADAFSIYVPSGKTLKATVSSTAFPPLIEFRDGTTDATLGAGLASSAGATGNTVSLSMTGGGFVKIWIASQSPNAPGGSYTITIDP